MAGLVPAIHVFSAIESGKTWMPGTRPGMTKFKRRRAQSKIRAMCLQHHMAPIDTDDC